MVGTLAAVFALVTVLTNRWTTRMKATVDLLERLETHDHFQKSYRAFRQVRLEPNGIQRIAMISTGAEITERDKCLDFLNIYELIALSIRKTILDEKFYLQAYDATIARDWDAAAPLIKEMRTPSAPDVAGDPHVFEHFEWLVKRSRRKGSWRLWLLFVAAIVIAVIAVILT
jgi:hypothetical protein